MTTPMVAMKHDFLQQPDGEAADRFRSWLETETIDLLRRSNSDAERLKAAIFLYVNRAYEAHMSDGDIGALFGRCLVTAGICEEDQDFALDTIELLGEIAKNTHESR